jgi:hypothetical protein
VSRADSGHGRRLSAPSDPVLVGIVLALVISILGILLLALLPILLLVGLVAWVGHRGGVKPSGGESGRESMAHGRRVRRRSGVVWTDAGGALRLAASGDAAPWLSMLGRADAGSNLVWSAALGGPVLRHRTPAPLPAVPPPCCCQ